jgi:serine protease
MTINARRDDVAADPVGPHFPQTADLPLTQERDPRMRRALLLIAALALAVTSAPAFAATTAPNDPLWGQQWGPQQVRASQAWATSTGAGEVIAIVDSGVDLSHPDLQGKLVSGATFAGCPKASCGNGDWKSGDTGAPDPHGTHVAGIAAAATNNGTGIAGVAPDAKIMPVKVLGEKGGSFEEIAAGIRWSADNGADVINMSLGALPGVQALEITGLIKATRDAIAYANTKGVVVVVAAGNEASPLCASPAFNNGALCVTATDRNEAKAWYSNLGVKPDLRAVAAPGGQGLLFCREDIISTVPAGTESTCGRTTPGYDAYAGTSMAAPHVAGVAALLTAQGRTNTQTYEVLTSTARMPVTGVRGFYDPVYGYGIVDAEAAVAAPGAAAVTSPTTTPKKSSNKGGKRTK